MKKLIYLIMAVWAFTSCNDSDEAFTVEISAKDFISLRLWVGPCYNTHCRTTRKS